MKEINLPDQIRQKLCKEGKLNQQELVLVSDSGNIFFAWDVVQDTRRVLEGFTSDMLVEGKKLLKG